MQGSIYQRGKIWWVAWYESVKDPATGKVRRKQRYESSGSERKSDAQTLLNTKVYESKNQKPRLDLPDPTYEECRDAWLRYRATKAMAVPLEERANVLHRTKPPRRVTSAAGGRRTSTRRTSKSFNGSSRTEGWATASTARSPHYEPCCVTPS